MPLQSKRLLTCLKRHGRLTPEVLLDLLKPLCAALEVAKEGAGPAQEGLPGRLCGLLALHQILVGSELQEASYWVRSFRVAEMYKQEAEALKVKFVFGLSRFCSIFRSWSANFLT